MKRSWFFISLFCIQIISAQYKKVTTEVAYNYFTALGKNFASDGLTDFHGLGTGIGVPIFKGTGIGTYYSRAYGSVKDISIYGNLKEPRLSIFNVYAYYHYNFSEQFSTEFQAGISDMRIRSKSYDGKHYFREGGSSGFLGLKGNFLISRINALSLDIGSRFYFYHSNVTMGSLVKDRYYSKVLFWNFNLGFSVAF